MIARGRPRWVVCCSYETEYEAESQFGSSHNSTAPNVVLVLDAEGEVLDQVVYVSGPSPHSPRLPAACLKRAGHRRTQGRPTSPTHRSHPSPPSPTASTFMAWGAMTIRSRVEPRALLWRGVCAVLKRPRLE